jgi:uncharacterized peroxidase-related enzyme
MTRVHYVEKEQADPAMREAFQNMEDRGQVVLNLFKVMANCPHIGRNFLRLGNSILTGEEVPADIRELAILRVGVLAQSKYEVGQHTVIGLKCGVRQKQIDDLAKWSGSKEFNDKDRAVLQYTDEVAQNVKVTDGTFAELKKYFSDHAIVELTTTVGFYGMACRILIALQIDVEEGKKA